MPIAHLPGIPTLSPHFPLTEIIMDYSNLTFTDVQNILQQQQQTIHEIVNIQTQQADQIADLTKAIDSSWTLNSAYLVFIMQLGFALLEAGSVRAMNTKNILMQNIMDTGISIIAFWLVGYGIATTDGTGNLGIGDMAYAAVSKHVQYPIFIFLWSFNNCATTIVSGAVTSRIKFSAYMASAIMVSGIIFPVVAYWTWGYGFLGILNPNGWKVIDFAGGLVVHVVGGCTGLMGILVLGPRESRFAKDEHGKPVPKEPGHSIVLATIGMFLLWFGWFGFNSGSTQAMSGGRYLVAGQAAVNSLLAAGASMITMCIWSIVEDKVHDSWELLNGILCGLVAVTPAVATVEPWAAIVIGIISVAVYRGMTRALVRFEIDDVVDAFSLHGMNGAWGCIATALFSTQGNCDLAFGPGHIDLRVGHQLGIHLAALIIVAAFTCIVSGAMFWIMHKTVGIRVSLADERVGLDFKYHAGYAYPDFNVRVKRAKEQMQLEAEIGNAVRREIAAGRGARFKEAAAIGSSHAIPVASSNKGDDHHELSMMASRRSSNKMGSGGSVVAVAPTKTTELSGARSTGLASGSTHGNGNGNGNGAVNGPAGGQHFIPMRKSSIPSAVSPESHSSRWATSSPHMSTVADELPSAHTQQNPAHKRSSTGNGRMNIAIDSPVESHQLASSYAVINNPNSPSSS